MNTIPTTTLNNGVEMPMLGFGVFQITDPAECEQAVVDALDSGYRLIDTAASYGNEESVGNAIRRSGVAREDIFLVTKLWIADASEEKAAIAFQRSLDRLGVEYVDLYLIHQPFGDYYGAWRAMEANLKNGHARAIGVSNFAPDRLVDLVLNSEITPAVNQIEIHPHHAQHKAIEIARELGVQPMGWAPFAENRNDLLFEPTLQAIGNKCGKSVPQVILRWLHQRSVIAIPKSVRQNRMEENLNVFDFELSEADMTAIAAIDRGESSFFSHRDPDVVKRLVGMARNT